MIDQSKLRAPGWQRVVAEMSASVPDDRAFLARSLEVMAQVSGARTGALVGVDPPGDGAEPEPRILLSWPANLGSTPREFEGDVRHAARAAASTGQMQVFALDAPSGPFYDASGAAKSGYLVAAPIPPGQGEGQGARMVIALEVESRSPSAMQTTLAILELLSGYAHAHATRQNLKRARSAAAALDLAGRLISTLNAPGSFRGCALQFTNDLARLMGADRAALGWVRGAGEGGAVRTIALSDTEHIDRRLAMVQKIEAAMDECLDQEQPVAFPVPGESRAGEAGSGDAAFLGRAISHAHRELCASDARLKAASFPLRADDRVIGVVTLETTTDKAFDPAAMELAQATLDLVAPVLRVRREADRSLAAHGASSARRFASMLVGPTHTGWKLLSLAGIAATLAVIFVRAPYRVEAPMELSARDRRIISAPFNGVISSLGATEDGGVIERGREVRADEVLVQLDTSELLLGVAQAESEIEQAQAQADLSLQEGKISEAQQAEAKARGARAQLELLHKRLRDATIRSPIDGVVLAGELRDRIGASVKVGDGLLEVAPLDSMVAVIKVSDADITLLTDILDRGGTIVGEVAAKGEPSKRVGFVVESVVPLARAEEGRNAFEVRARLERTEAWMRPGMEGLAKIETGDRRLIDIGTRRIRDTLRLWLWW